MNKKPFAKQLSELLYSSLGRGVLIFLVFGAAYTAYSVTFPTVEPSPASGVVGLYVGATAASYDGNDAGGYAAADSLCNTDYPGAHVCRAEEITNSYTHAPTALQGINNILWVHTGRSVVTDTPVNDCQGWTQSISPYFGSVWNFTAATPLSGAQPCTASYAYACCI